VTAKPMALNGFLSPPTSSVLAVILSRMCGRLVRVSAISDTDPIFYPNIRRVPSDPR